MDFDAQLKLQAFLDGELSEPEEVANWLAKDKEAVDLHAELRNTRQAMRGAEIGIELPESRGFYWSKIEREIRRLQEVAPPEIPIPFFARLRRLLVPATAIALLLLGGLLVSNELRPRSSGMETTLADASALVYHNDGARTTLIWLSYPADNEVADQEETDTID